MQIELKSLSVLIFFPFFACLMYSPAYSKNINQSKCAYHLEEWSEEEIIYWNKLCKESYNDQNYLDNTVASKFNDSFNLPRITSKFINSVISDEKLYYIFKEKGIVFKNTFIADNLNLSQKSVNSSIIFLDCIFTHGVNISYSRFNGNIFLLDRGLTGFC